MAFGGYFSPAYFTPTYFAPTYWYGTGDLLVPVVPGQYVPPTVEGNTPLSGRVDASTYWLYVEDEGDFRICPNEDLLIVRESAAGPPTFHLTPRMYHVTFPAGQSRPSVVPLGQPS